MKQDHEGPILIAMCVDSKGNHCKHVVQHPFSTRSCRSFDAGTLLSRLKRAVSGVAMRRTVW
jgi:hypothetical protein